MKRKSIARIPVSEDDIMHAKCLDPHTCMVRMAALRFFKEVLGLVVTHLRVRGNGITLTHRTRSGRSITEYWSVPMTAYNKICLFDEARDAIKARPDRKMFILKALGVQPFVFTSNFIKSRINKPTSPERQAEVQENRKKLVAYWARREKKEPGVTPRGYFSGVRRRYASTVTPPRPAMVRKALAEALRAA